MVCQGLRGIAEEVLYRHVRINTQTALDAFRTMLKTHPHKANWMRSFVCVPQYGDVGGPRQLTKTLAAILNTLRYARLTHIELRFPYSVLHTWSDTALEFMATYGCRGLALPESVRSVDTSVSFMRGVREPLPSLTCLSLSLRCTELHKACREIARVGATLLRLRLKRRMPWRMGGESPVRICALLNTPQLEYLEVQDEAIRQVRVGLGYEAENESAHLRASNSEHFSLPLESTGSRARRTRIWPSTGPRSSGRWCGRRRGETRGKKSCSLGGDSILWSLTTERTF